MKLIFYGNFALHQPDLASETCSFKKYLPKFMIISSKNSCVMRIMKILLFLKEHKSAVRFLVKPMRHMILTIPKHLGKARSFNK